MRILRLNKKNYHKALNEVVAAIKNGEVIVCPTDTIYGLVCDATNQKAVKKIILMKKRLPRKPIPIFVRNLKMAKKFAYIDKEQEEILKKAWPGKVTTVLRSKKGSKTIGIRIPKYKFILDLISKLNLPLAETSVNLSGKPALSTIKGVLKHFRNQKNQPDLVINAGNFKKPRPSTVIDLTVIPSKILRE